MTFVPPPTPLNPPLTPSVSLSEFTYVPQGSVHPIGIVVNTYVNGQTMPVNVDNGEMVVSIYTVAYPGTAVSQDGVSPVFTASVTAGTVLNPQTGAYSVNIPPTVLPGYYRSDWSFTLNGNPQSTSVYIQVGPPSQVYDSLSLPFVNMVENIWLKFADIYDSPFGGPHLTVWYNSHFGRGRIAQLMEQACQHLNNEAQPVTAFSTTGVSASGSGAPLFPLAQFAGLLNTATTIEVVKHLKRSYTEVAQLVGTSTPHLDRSSYQQRWNDILNDEQMSYNRQLAVWKTQMMFNGSPRVLIQGGAFGNYAVPRFIGSIPARPYYLNRWFAFPQSRPISCLAYSHEELGLTRGCRSGRPWKYEKYIW